MFSWPYFGRPTLTVFSPVFCCHCHMQHLLYHFSSTTHPTKQSNVVIGIPYATWHCDGQWLWLSWQSGCLCYQRFSIRIQSQVLYEKKWVILGLFLLNLKNNPIQGLKSRPINMSLLSQPLDKGFYPILGLLIEGHYRSLFIYKNC